MFKRFKEWYLGSMVGCILTLVLGVLVGIFGIGSGVAALKCNAYADGKGQEWSITLPEQCWIVVDGKNYTPREYAYKFEGIRITD
jgi:hypothetical protein